MGGPVMLVRGFEHQPKPVVEVDQADFPTAERQLATLR
jgi:hypothetical protein